MNEVVILVSGSTTSVNKFKCERIGGLIQPRSLNRPEFYISRGLPWALDNACFTGLDRAAFIRMLKAYQGLPGCLWCVAPDVVSNAAATLTRFKMWYPALKYFGYPVAYAAQDGVENSAIPWPYIDCLFIGGTTEFKLGEVAAKYVKQAKSRGKWVHMGRVNSRRRMLYASSIEVDSVDGTGFSRFGEDALPWGIGYAAVRQARFDF